MFVPAEATILHADADSFFASVEQRDDPRLRGKPVIVGGGVVLACSYEAKAFGVRSAMGGHRARRLCPKAIVVEPRMSAYVEASKAMLEVFDDTSPLVEAISIDEAFLDVRGMERFAGTPAEIAKRLRGVGCVRRSGSPLTVGVACTKFLAKVASAVAKPDGLLVVPAGRRARLPAPAPRRTAVGGRAGHRGQAARGAGSRRSRRSRSSPRSSSSRCSVARPGATSTRWRTTTTRAASEPAGGDARWDRSMRSAGARRSRHVALDAVLVAIVDRLCRRLRKAHRACRTVTLRLRFDDFARATRSHTLLESTFETRTILATARELLATAMPHDRGEGRHARRALALQPRDDDAVQLALPLEERSVSALDSTVDELRERFGSEAITRASQLGRRLRPSMPLLPD